MTPPGTLILGKAVAVLVLCLLWQNPGAGVAAAASSVPKEAQAAFEKQQYQQALDVLEKMDQSKRAEPDVRRLKVRSLVRLGKPKDALDEYDTLEKTLKRDDEFLLREVAFGLIVVLVKDMREQMRGAAYTALKEIESDEVVPYFEDGLSDGSGAVRALAVEGLGRSEAGRNSKKLRGALEDQAALVKARVVKVLGKTGDASVIPLLDAATKDENSSVRTAAYAGLLRLGRKEAWEQLRQAADAANPEDRAEALRAIAELKDQRGGPIMTELLTYSQPSVRGASARGLGHLGRVEARGKIESLLRDPVPAVREAAAAGLGELGGKESVPALTKALTDGAVSVRASAVAALLQLGEPFQDVAPTVSALTRQNDTAARASAAFALGKAVPSNAQEAISVLAGLTADPLPGPKIVALRSLGHIGDRNVRPVLKEALHDQNEAVRATAGGALLHVLADKSQRK
jgi:HEAT repeat protein